jgi:hypothetical protein
MLKTIVLSFVAMIALGGALLAQDGSGGSPSPAANRAKPSTTTPPTHRFWDKENDLLFAGVAASRMLDYASTRHFRDLGDNEVLLTNAIVDNRPLFVGIELAGTAASIGVSYAFHRTGHHSLERWVSIVHMGVAVGGSIHNYALKAPEQTSANQTFALTRP